MSEIPKANVLVIAATGKQGIAFCEVLMSTNRYNVFGTSRSSNNPKLTRLGVTTVVFQYDSEASISDALDIAKPSFLVIITDFVNAAKMNKETEIRHAKIIIDACKQAPCLTHVIFSSVFGADTCPEQLSAFRSKFVIENYLKESGLSHSILRPGGFFESFHDEASYNPLVKGRLKGLFPKNSPYIACLDIAKAGAVIFDNYASWKGKTLTCISYQGTGDECAAALSRASNVKCVFRCSISQTTAWWLSTLRIVPFLYSLIVFGSSFPNTPEAIEEFKRVVPDAMDAETYFRRLGRWSNGDKFS